MPAPPAAVIYPLPLHGALPICVNMSHSSFVKCDCLARSERPDLLRGQPRAFGDDSERHPAFEQGFRRAAEARTYVQLAEGDALVPAFPARRMDDAVAVPAF